MKKQYCVLWMTVMVGTITAQSNKYECVTPSNENGICVNIKHCPKLLALLENRKRDAYVIAYLRNSICGYENIVPRVCCPSEIGSPSAHRPSFHGTISSPHLPSQNECGQVNGTNNRIVGGRAAELGSWPWMVALGYQMLDTYVYGSDLQWLCGGTLISSRHVLTAAHCVVNLTKNRLAVARVGDLDLNPDVRDGASPMDVPIVNVVTHEKYDGQVFINDIALLKLKNTVQFNPLVQPICLPVSSGIRSYKLTGTKPFVAGWGSVFAESFPSEPFVTSLMEVQVPILDNAECEKVYGNITAGIDNTVLCAGYLDGGKDSCRGDSGGPLMIPQNGKFYLVGIVSYGYRRCAEPGYPGVYTRVSSYVEWIVEQMDSV